MTWERDPLLDKAKLFFEYASKEPAEDPRYGLWCSLGLELLARAAVASVSPVLLAEPVSDHKHLLHALGVTKLSAPQSISVAQVLALCQSLFADFTAEDAVASKALINRRNAELHSGEAAFDSYHSKQWLPGFYHSCSFLAKALGETLESVLGAAQATVAAEVLKQSREDVLGRVKSSIAAYKKVFDGKSTDEQQAAAADAQKRTEQLVHERHHKVECPACGCNAVVEGDAFGPEKIDHEEGQIILRQSVSPRAFNCFACGLKLTGYADLDAAELGGIYTRRTSVSPDVYYGLIDPENIDEYLAENYQPDEYDNE